MKIQVLLALLFLYPLLRSQDVAPPPRPEGLAAQTVAPPARPEGLAAQTVAPPPPTDGPSLQATLKFIEEKITDEGKFVWATEVTDTAQNGLSWSNNARVEISDSSSDVASCSVSFHWQSEMNGVVVDNRYYSVNFKDVRSVAVMTQDQNQAQVDKRYDHPTWVSKTAPDLFALVARRPKGLENAFLFSDQSVADRVAKAMVHAVELCGGQGDPF